LPAAPKSGSEPETIPMWKDEPVKAVAQAASLLTGKPASEYDGFTLDEYLKMYRSAKSRGGDDRKVTLEQSGQPLYGRLTNNNNEVYRYSPQNGFVGVDRFALKATDGTLSDTDFIEIVVNPAGSVNRFEIFPSTSYLVKTSQLMFCAVKRTKIDAIQAFITRADAEVVESHQILSGANLAYADVTVLKRLTSGGVVAFGNTPRFYNTARTNAITPTGGNELNPGECLIAQVKDAKGQVWGLSLDIYSTLSE
jgi:hypothetical protein